MAEMTVEEFSHRLAEDLVAIINLLAKRLKKEGYE